MADDCVEPFFTSNVEQEELMALEEEEEDD